MGTAWRGFVLGEPAPSVPPSSRALAALALPAEHFYFKRIPLPAAKRHGIRDLRGYAAGAIDPDLPVAVEDCLVYCRPDSGGLSVFAIEKSKLGTAAKEAEKELGRQCDCIVPLPLAIWERAAEAAGHGGFAGLLFHLHADGPRWTLCAGNAVRRGVPPLKAVATVAAGDTAGVRRAAAILASRLSGLQGGKPSGAAVSLSGGNASEELAAALAAACGLPESANAATLPLDTAEAVASYAKRNYLKGDLPMAETESAAVKRARFNRSLFPAAAAAAGAALLLFSSAVRDISARGALRATDTGIELAAARLAGVPLRQKGPAAIAPARNAFAERFPEKLRDFIIPAPRDILRTVFAFAVARDISLDRIESNGSRISFALDAERGDDIEALAEELRRAGFNASAEAAAPQGTDGAAASWLLTVEMEAPR